MGILIAFCCCFLFRWPCFVAHEILVLPPPVEPADPELEAPSLKNWTAREVPGDTHWVDTHKCLVIWRVRSSPATGFLCPYPPLHSTTSRWKQGARSSPPVTWHPNSWWTLLLLVFRCSVVSDPLQPSGPHGELEIAKNNLSTWVVRMERWKAHLCLVASWKNIWKHYCPWWGPATFKSTPRCRSTPVPSGSSPHPVQAPREGRGQQQFLGRKKE